MPSIRSFLAPAAALALLAVTGCANNFEARVNRFQALPAPAGQSFAIQAHDPRKAGGLEFATYANLVRQKLLSTGYTEAAPGRATLVVNVDYAVSPPREKVQSYPGFGPQFGYYGGFYGYGRGGRHFYPGFYGSFYDPFWGYPEVTSTTLYNAFVEIRINRTSDNVSVFEGRAETVATTNNLTQLVPNLVQAVFAGFPGNSGETIRVKFDPARPDVPPVIASAPRR